MFCLHLEIGCLVRPKYRKELKYKVWFDALIGILRKSVDVQITGLRLSIWINFNPSVHK